MGVDIVGARIEIEVLVEVKATHKIGVPMEAKRAHEIGMLMEVKSIFGSFKSFPSLSRSITNGSVREITTDVVSGPMSGSLEGATMVVIGHF